MPDTLTPPAPPAESGGVAASFEKAFSPVAPTPTPAPEAPKTPETPPAETPQTPPADKKPEVAPEVKPAPAAKKEFTDPEIEAERKSNPNHKAWKILDSIKAKYSTETAALKAEVERIKAKPVEGVADAAKIKAYEDRIAELAEEGKTWRQRVEEADYTRSEDYSNKFVKPFNNEKRRALDVVKSLTVTYDKDGEPQTRQATESDFNQALNISDPAAQDAFIQKTFGHSAWRVVNHINELTRIREAANQAVTDHAAQYEKNKLERELRAKQEDEEFGRDFQSESERLKSDPDWGKYLSERQDDPEGSTILKTELAAYDELKETYGKLPLKERAAKAALIRARFAETPGLRREVKQLTGKVASLEAELAKFRGADPGNPIKTAVGGKPAEAPAGIEARIGAMSWDGKQ